MMLDVGKPINVNSRKFDGSLSRTWECKVVAVTETSVDLIGEFKQAVGHADLGIIEAGTVSQERFYLNRWYNVFRFENPSGSLRNYYINISMPPTWADGKIEFVDLDLDLIVWPDGGVDGLDLGEFEANSVRYAYPPSVRIKARDTYEELLKKFRGLVRLSHLESFLYQEDSM